LVDSSSTGFSLAMGISCHSFIRTARLAEAQMKDNGGTLITMTYYGSEKVVNHYGIMGPIKAALESSVRYMASELGASGIRVEAGSGITDFHGLMDDAVTRSPLHRLGKPEDVGRLTAFLISDWAASQTGSQMFVDAGHHIMA
jgi:enoyl-[acyl-carrier protein] reductase I